MTSQGADQVAALADKKNELTKNNLKHQSMAIGRAWLEGQHKTLELWRDF
jgi:hypothetical protein